jgi:hypothetical protein
VADGGLFQYANRGRQVVQMKARCIDYHLNLLGIRVWQHECQLVAKGDGDWHPIGPKWPLPLRISRWA